MVIEARSFRKNPKIEEAPLQGELMLFDPASARFFVLNPTMAFLWRRCDGEGPFSAVVEDLAREFDAVELARASLDLRAALEELVRLDLVVDAGPVSR